MSQTESVGMVGVQHTRKDILTQDKGSNRGGGVRGMSVGLNGRNGEGGQRLGKGANLYWRFFYVSHIGWGGSYELASDEECQGWARECCNEGLELPSSPSPHG